MRLVFTFTTNLLFKGKLGFDEFTKLWRNIRHWCQVFKKHDTDSSNSISAHELRAAFHEIGLNVNRHILQLLIHRYGAIGSANKKDTTPEKSLTFDDFIHSSMKLKHSIDIWNAKAKTAQQTQPSNSPQRVLPFAVNRYTPNLIQSTAQNTNNSSASFSLEEVSCHSLYLKFILILL